MKSPFVKEYFYSAIDTFSPHQRNKVNILFSTMQIIYIVQYFVVPNISSANPIPTIIFNILIFVSLIVMEVFWIDRKNEVRYKSLQEIEFEILGDDKTK
jgi:hypothetical protein